MEKLKIISLREINVLKIDAKYLVEKLINLDFENIKYLKIEDEGTIEQWYPIFLENPDTWRILMNSNNEIVGYWHFVPLKNNIYEKIKFGKIHEIQIRESDVKKLIRKGSYRIYFRSIVLNEKYRKTGASKFLIDSFFEVLEQLTRKDIFIEEMCANAYTLEGNRLCEKLGMQYIGENKHQGKLYFLRLDNLSKIELLKNHEDLIELYKKNLYSDEI